ncbi:MAG TPA: glycosyltransferase family 2 protein [Candidatus Saccharimonadales bacterium]|nr:glycosyltransferase family 2 protein [Candidatus Saccharimonadales bacterium]
MAKTSAKTRVGSLKRLAKKPSVKRVVYPKKTVIVSPERVYKRKLALLLPGHNEELIIEATIHSAVAAGQNIADIYFVNDASSDQSRGIATKMLGKDHVLNVHRSGKAGAVLKAIKKFNIESRYLWLHVADADSVFGKDYFRIYRKKLQGKDYAVAVGFVQSLRGNWISHYRSFTYTYSQHIIRRAQSWFNMISVFPGPITCFRTDILSKLEFSVDSLTEDFDITLQVHRKKLGKILFIPEAVNYTQDPQSLTDFCKQTARWQRGFFQGVVKYRIGGKPQAIDFSIGYQMLEMAFYVFQMGFLVPYVILTTGKWIVLPIILLLDFFVISILAFFSALAIRRLSTLASLPYFYFLRWLELSIFIMAFVEVVILRKFKATAKGWQTEGRRYALSALALKDTA